MSRAALNAPPQVVPIQRLSEPIAIPCCGLVPFFIIAQAFTPNVVCPSPGAMDLLLPLKQPRWPCPWCPLGIFPSSYSCLSLAHHHQLWPLLSIGFQVKCAIHLLMLSFFLFHFFKFICGGFCTEDCACPFWGTGSVFLEYLIGIFGLPSRVRPVEPCLLGCSHQPLCRLPRLLPRGQDL